MSDFIIGKKYKYITEYQVGLNRRYECLAVVRDRPVFVSLDDVDPIPFVAPFPYQWEEIKEPKKLYVNIYKDSGGTFSTGMRTYLTKALAEGMVEGNMRARYTKTVEIEV